MKSYQPTGEDKEPRGDRLRYEKPRLERVELAIDETLSSGCKLGSDSGCVGPPITAFEGGS
ncbi:MAG TPA: hypothetical protein PKE55_02300 [Kiritimatiellia bacterium]|nr:hypothetical protein [Kiritimatiellia bacterium]